MKAFEFKTCLSADGTLSVPSGVISQLARDQPVRVIMLVPESDDDADWKRLTTDQFLRGYAEGDAIYDNVSTR